MLIIYSALRLGGIETFFVRLARERRRQEKPTNILLLDKCSENDPELLQQMREVACVYTFEDVFYDAPLLRRRFNLLTPLRKHGAEKVLEGATQIHVTNGENALLADRLLNLDKKRLPITVGVYHSLEFAWGGKALPYFERVNREFVLKHLPSDNLMCFAASTKKFMQARLSAEIENAKEFRLGVIEGVSGRRRKLRKSSAVGSQDAPLKICAVGRLVEFKSYNLWMLDVVKALQEKGISVLFDIYGDGPLEEKIKATIRSKSLEGAVRMLGSFEYSQFDEVVSGYDIFVGSGTAIIQAASCGIPSIIGIESLDSPASYGFFSDYSEHEYHHPSLDFPKRPVVDLVGDFLKMSAGQREELSRLHMRSAEKFTMEDAVDNFERGYYSFDSKFNYSKILYYVSEKFFYKKHLIMGRRVDYTKTNFTN
ncbi:glycosyltransferase family 4 protein [Halomonas desiderata]|uniref:glycosyltransferase family 4 protein n=1 Tax=Billgrantia desiderata TaxID=52021 RepID=UPI00174824D1|nr:glycosyltransferase family 4 protein [Halomonas desiderata]